MIVPSSTVTSFPLGTRESGRCSVQGHGGTKELPRGGPSGAPQFGRGPTRKGRRCSAPDRIPIAAQESGANGATSSHPRAQAGVGRSVSLAYDAKPADALNACR